MFHKSFHRSIDRLIVICALCSAISATYAFGTGSGRPCADPLKPRCNRVTAWVGCNSETVGQICTSIPHAVTGGACVEPGNSAFECKLHTVKQTCAAQMCIDLGFAYECVGTIMTPDGLVTVKHDFPTVQGLSSPTPCNYDRPIDGTSGTSGGCN